MVELIPESYVARLDLEKIFGRIAPLHVDLGCGDGSFLCALAGRCPEKNFLGIERLTGRVAKACRKAAQLDNVRLLHLETSYTIRYLLPESSVEAFYLLFPDPWPKRRHHHRRIVTPEFLNAIHAALEPNGLLWIATDQLDYFQHITRLFASHSRFENIEADAADLPLTKFERRFCVEGVPIYRCVARKVSRVM